MILRSVRWYLTFSLSYRDIEEIMEERGFDVDHSTIQSWVVHYAPQLEKAFHQRKKRPGDRWRLDETYIKVKGQWKSAALYRLEVPAGDSAVLRLRLAKDGVADAFAGFDEVMQTRIDEADAFSAELQANIGDTDMARVQRRALAGMICGKQFYYIDVPRRCRTVPPQ